MVSVKKKTTTKAKASVKKTAAKKSAMKKPAAKKSAAKKPVAKKTTPKATEKFIEKPKGLPEQMLDAALKVLDEKQAQEIVSVPLAGRSSLADYMIIASGRSNRQVVALADNLAEAFYKLGVATVRIEGKADGNWVLVDTGDIIVHLFQPDVRRYYDLDTLWDKKTKKK